MLQTQIMARYWNQDILGILRGAQNVINAMVKQQEVQCKQIWENSSVKSIVEETSSSVNRGVCQSLSQGSIQNDSSERLQEIFQRTSVVYEGIKGYVRFYGGKSVLMIQ